MEKRESITLSFCEKCGEKVFSRDESCSGCGTLPYQWDRDFRNENNIPLESFFDDWSEELMEKLDFWCDIDTEIHYCKDCGKPNEEISKYEEYYVSEETGEVIITKTHPCNPNSPLFE